ncbi:MAG: phosphate-binding protein, partial [Planctomycetota bacterium]|nr:phosphate-binding protein [Planctomycetota bacterium]
SGTYGYFKDVALFGGDFKDSVKEQPGSSAVVQGIANDKYGIGYSGIGYLTADVAAVPLARDTGSRMTPATPENAYTGEYPLARFLYVYVNHRPGARLDPLRREFVRFIFSRQGQMQVLKDGYFPITAAVATDNLARVGIRR